MSPFLDRRSQLRRMEEACRQTRHQLALLERQIVRKITRLIPSLGHCKSGYRRGKPSEPDAFLARYRSHLAVITAERQPEIDALTRKLARQEAAIAALQSQRCQIQPERKTA